MPQRIKYAWDALEPNAKLTLVLLLCVVIGWIVLSLTMGDPDSASNFVR